MVLAMRHKPTEYHPTGDDLCVWDNGSTCYHRNLDDHLEDHPDLKDENYEIIPHEESPSLVINDGYIPEFSRLRERDINWCSSDLV